MYSAFGVEHELISKAKWTAAKEAAMVSATRRVPSNWSEEAAQTWSKGRLQSHRAGQQIASSARAQDDIARGHGLGYMAPANEGKATRNAAMLRLRQHATYNQKTLGAGVGTEFTSEAGKAARNSPKDIRARAQRVAASRKARKQDVPKNLESMTQTTRDRRVTQYPQRWRGAKFGSQPRAYRAAGTWRPAKAPDPIGQFA